MRGARTAPTSRFATARPAATSIPRSKPAASASACAGAGGERVADARGGGGGDEREPERPADLERGGDDARGRARVLVRDLGDGGDLVGHADERQPEAEDDQAGQQSGRVAGVRRPRG